MSAYRVTDTDSSGPTSGQFDTGVWQHAKEKGTGYQREPVRPTSTKVRQMQGKYPSFTTTLFNVEKFYCNVFRLMHKEPSQADKILKKTACHWLSSYVLSQRLTQSPMHPIFDKTEQNTLYRKGVKLCLRMT